MTYHIALFAFMIFLPGCADREGKTEVQPEETPTAEPEEVLEPGNDIASAEDSDERSEEIDTQFQWTVSEEERECMQLWKEEYHRPLKGEEAGI